MRREPIRDDLLVNTDVKMGTGYMIIDSGQPTASRKGIALHESDVVVRSCEKTFHGADLVEVEKFATLVHSSTEENGH